ncbi:DUF465 domain-containing protein [Zavarzinia sp. CC-PAN008]|uniref:DUF465 domain-containing protein n=1 Tax=Zavarzinia sp. CC-PAN008 TaxID=3243332 RepID=UPI003F749A08
MTLKSHIDSLSHKHSNLDEAIHLEHRRPAPDTIRLKELKLQKLKVKEEIQRLSPR